jgi:broad specificity polyphosphatase/5'/3'-nucleotidase SurE
MNVPYLPEGEIQGVSITRMGLRIYRDQLVTRYDPRERPYYWIGGEPPTGVPDEGTDFWALSRDYISITPIQLDMTAYQPLMLLLTGILTTLSMGNQCALLENLESPEKPKFILDISCNFA